MMMLLGVHQTRELIQYCLGPSPDIFPVKPWLAHWTPAWFGFLQVGAVIAILIANYIYICQR